MSDQSIIIRNVSFTYERATQPLINNLSVHFTRGWTGIVGANGVGKTTILKLATGDLAPQHGKAIIPDLAIYCPQRTDDPPELLDELIHSVKGDSFKIKGQLGIKDDWLEIWTSLSHGERKRAQIAVAMWRKPQVLAVDEPTNHLDVEAQHFLFTSLSSFQGVGLLVSHDRGLLDDLCHQCLFVEPPGATLRPGNYTHGLLVAEKHEMAARKQRSRARRDFLRIKREAARRRDAAAQSDRRRSKKDLSSKDHDSRAKINLVRVSGKDGIDGKRANQLKGRLSQARLKMDSVKVKKTYTMGIWMPGAQSKRNTLFNLPTGSLSLGGNRRLHFPDLSMSPADRIALTGLNGSGKSTLISHIIQSPKLELNRVTYIPQEIDIDASKDIMEQARNLPNEKLGLLMTVVSRLGSRPQRLLDSVEPSPGEIRKILLATGIANEPYLIVMDEPTNHLDLPSIACLEEALVDCPCGLLLVSHDRRFLDELTHNQWHIHKDQRMKGKYLLQI